MNRFLSGMLFKINFECLDVYKRQLLVFMTTIVIFAAAIPGTIDSFNKQEAFDIQIFFSPLAGLFPALLYLFLFQNNPIRWFLAVRKYEQGKVIFNEEIEKRG